MENDQTVQKQVDLDFIHKKIEEGYRFSEEAEGRDLILVIGNTGVGKSTTCNYLLGHKMISVSIWGKSAVDTDGKFSVKIGHQVAAETLYARSLPIDNPYIIGKYCNYFCLLDCPGFYGNRTIEEKVIESVSTELAIRNCKQVKGILILISINTLSETKVGELRNLMKTLIALFEDPVEMVQYSIFIITKKYRNMPDKEAKEITIGAIQSLLHHCDLQSQRLFNNPNLNAAEDLTYADYAKIATYFSAVLAEKGNNIILIDPLDNGQSRRLIFERINGIKPRKGIVSRVLNAGISTAKQMVGMGNNEEDRPITINDFNFSAYDEHRVLFHTALYHLAGDGYKLMNKIIKEMKNIKTSLLEVTDSKERLLKLNEEKATIEGNLERIKEGRSQHLRISYETKKSWESTMDRNKQRILSKKCLLNEKINGINALTQELAVINHDEPWVFRENKIKEHVSKWKIFGWVEMKFEANTRNEAIPIISIDKEELNGKWYDEKDRRDEGFYKVTYKSNFRAKPAFAKVIAYIRTRDDTGNKIKIECINETLEQLEKEKKDFETEISEIEANNAALRINIDNVDTDVKGQQIILEKALEKCVHDIEFYNSKIIEKEEEIEKVKVSGLANFGLFDIDERKYDILVKIQSLLKLPSSLMPSFISTYNSFLPEIGNYRSYFERNIIDLKSSDVEEKIVYGMRDPITGKEIKDIAITREGTAFDVHSLLQQFDVRDPDNVPPFEFKRKDGTIEIIEYGSWHKVDKQQYQEYCSISTESSVEFTEAEFDDMDEEELAKHRNLLAQEIRTMEAELEVKKTEAQKIDRKLEILRLNTEGTSRSRETMLEQDATMSSFAHGDNDTATIPNFELMTEEEQVNYAKHISIQQTNMGNGEGSGWKPVKFPEK